jgi:hypothetical protein
MLTKINNSTLTHFSKKSDRKWIFSRTKNTTTNERKKQMMLSLSFFMGNHKLLAIILKALNKFGISFANLIDNLNSNISYLSFELWWAAWVLVTPLHALIYIIFTSPPSFTPILTFPSLNNTSHHNHCQNKKHNRW